MDEFYAHVDKNADYFIDKLRAAVAIPSVSADAEHRPEVVKMGAWIQAEMDRLGVQSQRMDVGKHEVDGQTLDLPPIILGSYRGKTNAGKDNGKKTLLVYGHYDVQPALKEDGWATDPWTLTEDAQGRLYGRGSSDDKGPVLGWLWVIECFQKLNIELPVNLKMCFEGMEESGSEGLDALIEDQADKYFADVDCVCISDNYWLGKTKPCLTHGLRGVSYFKLQVQGPGKDLHSGVFGGTGTYITLVQTHFTL